MAYCGLIEVVNLPIVKFLGPFNVRRSPCGRSEDFYRGVPREGTQAWLDQWRRALPASHWVIQGDAGDAGDAGETVDAGNDGIPDSGWTRKDIMKWLTQYDANPSRYATKTQLLTIVNTLMNPDLIDEVSDLTDVPMVEENIEVVDTTEEKQESDE